MMSDELVVNDKQAMGALKKHGDKIVWAIILVLAGYFGWEYYQKNYAKIDTVAADMYTAIDERNNALKLAIQNPDLGKDAKASLAKDESVLFAEIDKLVAEHPNTVYAWQALMLKARHQADADKLSDAIETLEQAQKLKLDDVGLLALTELRLARVLLDNNEIDKALTIANKELPKAFEASRQEVLGDIYVTKNDFEQAKTAYLTAWEALRERQENRAVLSLKLQSLGVQVESITPKEPVIANTLPNDVSATMDNATAERVSIETQTTQNGN
ncbi:tetratricopeptide repeat protein [Moraxella haemolytica]|uniref:YfgM family protein n=1 Tax=Moraxella haemolytica TaxID=2904119 RepID=UPI0025427F81|nr:tetratricopeptide repeat protein [Moraxella sp. ZY171148]WII94590.1 tetratricopeptide repeat protein [Moraxella sp. ZY171148]